MLSNVLDTDEILDQSGCACRGKESRSGASTRGMSQSRRFFSTATRSSSSRQSNRCLSRGSGRGKGVWIHGRRRLCSRRGWESVKTNFRESVLHVFILGAQ